MREGEGQGQANDERGAVAEHFEARFCTFGRDGSCHGWLGGGGPFRFLTEIGTRGVALRAAVSRPCGCTGAAISRQRNARPPHSILILRYRPPLRGASVDKPPAAPLTARTAGCVPANTPAPEKRCSLRNCKSPSVVASSPSDPDGCRADVPHAPWPDLTTG